MASAKRSTVYYDNILSNSKKLPDMKAIIDKFGKTAGYKDVINVCDAVEKLFLEIPIKAIDRIVIFSGGKIHMSLLLLPVVDNAIYVPLDMELTEDKYEYFFNLLKVTYVLTDDPEHIGCKTAKKLGIGIIKYNIQGNFNEFTCNIELLKRCRISADSERPANPEIMMIGMTSGTTSTPKIVPTTYKGQLADYYTKQKSFGYGQGDVVLVPNRFLNSMAMGDILAIWSVGGTAVATDGFDHSNLIDTIITNKVTIVRATPAVLSSFVGYAKKNNLRRFKSDLKYIRAGGAPLLKALKADIEDVFGAEAVHAYGMTEAKSIATTYKAPKGYKEGSAGVSIGPEIKILDGEILIKGDTVFIGYENPEIDNSQYFTDGWFHTGDMGYIDEDGYIFITGRIKEMINRGGEKISPYEVEKAILEHPDINDAAVFPYPNEYGSENAGAVIVTENDEIDLTMLRRFLHEKVSPYKMPTKLYITDEIPKSENNKVQRKMLYDQLRAIHPNADSASKKPDKQKLTKTQRSVKKIWKKALFRKNIELDDNFHDIGGDSLNGMLILGEIERKFKIKVPTDFLFSDGTINKVCSYLDSETLKWNSYRFLTPIKSTGSKKPLICLHSPMGDAVTYNHLGNYIEEERPIIGICFSRLTGDWKHPVTFDQMAERYIEEIVKYDPEGPYFICGFCYGGVLAFKVASLMKELGHNVAMLVMMDSASKNVIKKKPRSRHNIFQEIIIRLKDTREQLKPYPPVKKIIMIFYKIKRFFIYVYGFYTTKLYWIASKHNIRPLIALSRGNGALGYAYNKYKPKHYDGKLHYIKATERKKPNENEKYWARFADEFELFKMKSDHNGIIKGENARILVQYLTEIMEDPDA